MSDRRFLLLSCVLFTFLTVTLTYPQALRMGDSVRDDGDPLLVTWTFAWVAHQLPRAPARLFDANIFYPERRTLVFSETMLAPAVAAAPLHWAGAGRIFVYNLVFLAGFVLSGVGCALLVRQLTGHAGAGIVAGIVFAFLPYRIDQFSHLQLQQTQWIPLALWACDSLVRTGRVRDGVILGASVAGQALSCMYYGLFLAPYLAVVGAVLFVARRTFSRAHVKALASALVVAVAAVAPVAIAYVAARRSVGERAVDELIAGSATWTSYLAAPAINLLYGRTLSRFVLPERVLFPGFVPVLLALAAFLPLPSDTAARRGHAYGLRVAYLAALLVALDISFGLNGFTYRLLYEYVVPFRALRIPARMGVMVGFSLAVLAGFGVARLTQRCRPGGARLAVPVICAILLVIEYASRPVPLQRISADVPAVYSDLVHDVGDGPTSAIVEYPMGALHDPTYMYYSTYHWQRLVNGYSGFFPNSYTEMAAALESFPDDHAIGAIHARGVRYLLVHGERLIGTRYDRMIATLDGRTDLRLVSRSPAERAGQHGQISLYRVIALP